MADVEITPDQICEIDSTQVSSMQLKDGTVVVVNSEATVEVGEYQDQGEFTQEELPVEYDQVTEVDNQTNQLRARPMVGMPMGVKPVVPVRPAVAPVRPAVVPVKPAVVPVPGRPPIVAPKPIPRGPVVRPGVPMGGVVFRARPGMPVYMPPPKVVAPPKPVVPVRPAVPVMKPVVPVVPKPMVPVKPVGVPVRPVVPKPMVVPGRPGVFRARPNYNEEEDFQQEYAGEEDYYEGENYEETGEVNQLRARPGMPVYMPPQKVVVPPKPVVPVRPAVPVMKPVVPVVPKPMVPVKPVGVPVRPVVPKPMVVPGRPGVFRARPNYNEEEDFQQEYAGEEDYYEGENYEETGEVNQLRARPGMPVYMPPQKVVVPPKPVVPVRPAVPVMKPVVPVVPKPMVPVKPVGVPVRPVVPKPMVVPGRPGVFRARPNYNEEEDFQQEYAGEEDYYEGENYEETGEENQLRARPLVVPSPMTYGPGVVRPPVHHHPPLLRPQVAPLIGKRGPAVVKPGLNTFQPGVFRARPRLGVARPGAMPMFTPLAPGYGVGRVVRPMPPPPRPYGFGMGPVFRNRPSSSSANAQEYAEEYDAGSNYNTSSVCTKCGKEF